MTTNPLHFSTFSNSAIQMQDNIDFLHTGIIQSLTTAIEGNYVVSGCNVTQSAGSSRTNFAVAAGTYRKDHTLLTFTGGNYDLQSNPHSTIGYDWYGLLVITGASSVSIRSTVNGTSSPTTVTGSLAPQVPDFTQGDVIVGVIKVVGSTVAQWSSSSDDRPFQFLTYHTDAPTSLWLKEGSAPTDVAGYGSIYVKTDNNLYFNSDAAGELQLGAGGDFTISDGATTQTISTGNTLTFAAGSGLDVAVSATDTVTYTADVSDFMTNGANNYIVTATGTDGMNAEANFTFDGSTYSCTCDSATFTSATTNEPIMYISNTTNDATGGGLIFTNTRTTGNQADDDTIGAIQFKASDSAVSGATVYTSITGSISDVTNNDEGGKIAFKAMSGGTGGTAALNELLSLGGEDVANATKCEVVVNEAGIDCDFRVESDSNSAMLKVDAAGDRVGINSSTLLSGFNIGTSLNLDHATYSSATQTLDDTSPPFVIGKNTAHVGGMTITFPDPTTCEGRLIIYYTIPGSTDPITLDVATNNFSSGSTLTPNAAGNYVIVIATDVGGGVGFWLELIKNF